MSRRNSPGVQALVVVFVVVLFLYGYYSYHQVQTRLKRSEEKSDRLKQQQDSVSAQLQVVYEHKTRLEKAIQQDKDEMKKTREGFVQEKQDLETKYGREKQELLNRVNTISAENKRLQSHYDDLQSEMGKLQEKDQKLEEDFKKTADQNNLEYLQLRQERDNEAAQLKDQIADLKRKNLKLEHQLLSAKNDFAQVNENKQAQVRQQNLVAGGDKLNEKYNVVDMQGEGDVNGLDAQNRAVHHQEKRVGFAVEPPQVIVNNEIPKMQINKPDDEQKKAYFEPREGKPDHEVVGERGVAVVGAAVPHDNAGIARQVAPPDVHLDNRNASKQDAPIPAKDANVRNIDLGRQEKPVFPLRDPNQNDNGRIRDPEVKDNLRIVAPGGQGVAGFGHDDRVAQPDLNLQGRGIRDQDRDVGIQGHNLRFQGRNLGAQGLDSAVQGQVQKPEQIAIPQLHQQQENQVQQPKKMKKGVNNDDAEDAPAADGGAGDNDDEYEYKNKNDVAPLHNRQNRGPNAGPVDDDAIQNAADDEDDKVADGGL